ncbi:MAG: hypothetical protein A2X25_07570 [Chloroflexi bacterium GWB2_49_20]|nr:MAG: hypothetical protein A2X25_07570 [Chloroflexi bacterium GWB2_49_20]OGN78013.1 MAG: hypothetical protein A2X26_15375 [Chloroflexi bacterium GWC2_49_37]OGN85051.1 MAG: hypothetical protein A2X27_10075 [Chloroflexi bacterium GWD2_49_16]HBG74913.1 hypothetical protein [Anaerolineae bacterium]HCC78363.1 hypothetical protein [Anaerolineae bacterium]
MSKVYSFRLDENNPREVQAREVINAWILKGYSLRHILIEGLNKLNESNDSLDEVDYLMVQLREIIERSSIEKREQNVDDKIGNPLPLSSAFLSKIGNSLKIGIRIKQ